MRSETINSAALAIAPAERAARRAGDQRKARCISSANAAATPFVSRPAVPTTIPDCDVTICRGPPRSRHITGRPCESASRTTVPPLSCRLGKTNRSWFSVESEEFLLRQPWNELDPVAEVHAPRPPPSTARPPAPSRRWSAAPPASAARAVRGLEWRCAPPSNTEAGPHRAAVEVLSRGCAALSQAGSVAT